VLRGVVAGLACGWLAWTGAQALGLGLVPVAVAAGVTAAAAAFVPRAGLAAGLLLFAVAAAFAHPLAGVAAVVLGALWWTFVGRRHGWAGVIPVVALLLTVIGAAPALPLLIGFFIPGSWLALAVWASTASTPPLLQAAPDVLAHPLALHAATGFSVSILLQVLATAAAWALAAGIMSLLARRATRLSAAAGLLIGGAVLYAAAGPLATGGVRLATSTAVQLAVSLILVTVVIALGSPVEVGEDDVGEQAQ
jgi:hypothetical protein